MIYNFPDWSQKRVLVVGDIMLDRYWHGESERISPEAPVPVVRIQQIEDRPGGAANVALNIRALGGLVSLFGICGDDHEANLLQSKLIDTGVDCHFIRNTKKPTITKLRVLSLHQQMIRMDFEEQFTAEESETLITACLPELDRVQLIVLSDYGKGSLKQCQKIIAHAKQRNIPILVDPKGRDFAHYRGVSLLTPNRKEFENVVGICQNETEFAEKGKQLLRELDLQALLVTRGSQGMTLLRANMPELHLPAKAQEVYDVTGAGDTVIATLAITMAADLNIEKSVYLANSAAGVSVSKLGAATVSLPELRRALMREEHAPGSGILTEDQLMLAIQDAKAHGEKIVMTNGCFDILHAGHVAYLEQARALGDRLIVAVNDDDSVRKLKGPTRPINSLDRRMAVLAGLSSVDWVVPFAEETPERLICRMLPDVLVKGGDWRVEQIAGHQCVIANGGSVQILLFKEGCSSTAIINKLQEEIEL